MSITQTKANIAKAGEEWLNKLATANAPAEKKAEMKSQIEAAVAKVQGADAQFFARPEVGKHLAGGAYNFIAATNLLKGIIRAEIA